MLKGEIISDFSLCSLDFFSLYIPGIINNVSSVRHLASVLKNKNIVENDVSLSSYAAS